MFLIEINGIKIDLDEYSTIHYTKRATIFISSDNKRFATCQRLKNGPTTIEELKIRMDIEGKHVSC